MDMSDLSLTSDLWTPDASPSHWSLSHALSPFSEAMEGEAMGGMEDDGMKDEAEQPDRAPLRDRYGNVESSVDSDAVRMGSMQLSSNPLFV